MKNELSKEEMFDAIRLGVKEAFHEMMESGDGITGPIRTEEVMDAIRFGVISSFPTLETYQVERCIENGTYTAIKNR